MAKIEDFDFGTPAPKAGARVEDFVLADDGPEATWADTLATAAPRAGLALIQGGAGTVRAIGDALRISSVADWGAEIARNARGASEMVTPENQSFAQQAVSGGIESAAMMLPALVGGPAGLAARGIGLAMGQQFGESYADLRDKGFSGGAAGFHGSIRAIAEGLGEKVSIGVLSETGRPILNQLFAFMKRDLPGEQLTTAIQMLDAKLSDNPNMTIGEYLDAAAMTAAVSAVAGPGQVAAVRLASGAMNLAAPSQGGGEVPSATPGSEAPVPAGEPAAAAPAPVSPEPALPTPPASPPAPTAETVATEPPVENPVPAAAPAPTGETLPPPETPPAEPTVVLNPEPAPPPPAPDPTVAPAPAPPASPFPTPPDLFSQTPEQMAASQQVDPRIYLADPIQRMFMNTAVPRISYIEHLGNGVFELDLAKGTQLQGTADEVIDELVREGLPDLRTDPQKLAMWYDSHIIQELLRNPEMAAKFTPEVSARYGGVLDEIGQMLAARNTEVIGFPTTYDKRAKLWNEFGAALAVEPRLPSEHAGMYTATDGKTRDVTTLAGLKGLGAGTFVRKANASVLPKATVETRKTAQANYVLAARMVEALRARFMPNVTLLLDYTNDTNILGSSSHLGENLSAIQLSLVPSGLGTVDVTPKKGSLLLTIAHEFGHAIIRNALTQADPVTKLKLLKSYLEYTGSVKGNSSLREYMLTHHGDIRGAKPERTVAEQHAIDPDHLEYLLSPAEYYADQAAQYLVNRVEFSSPELTSWYSALVEKLRAVAEHVSAYMGREVAFKPNQDFVAWLDSLAGPGNITESDWGKKAKTKPPKTKPVEIEVTGLPEPVATTDANTKLLKQRKLLLDALRKAGATEEQLDAIEGDGTIAQFNFEAAFELADALGIPPSEYMSKPDAQRVDDTTSLREGLNNMNLRLADQELREDIGGAARDVKRFNWGLQKVITAVQLRKRFGALVPGVKSFVDTLERKAAYVSNWKSRADDRLKEMKLMSPAERERVFNLLLEEDKTGKFLSVPTPTAVGRTFVLPAEVAQRYKLTESGVRLYTQLRQDFDAALDEIQLNTELELQRQYGNSPGGAMRIQQLKEDFNRMRAAPYVPHSRFGTHVVEVRNAKGKVIEFYQHETESDAKKQESTSRAEQREHPGFTVSRRRLSEETRAMLGMPPQMVQAMKSQLNMDEKQIAAFEEILKDMSSGASFVRRFKKRNNTSGWESEAEAFPRAYADYFSRFANHAGRIRFNPELTDGVRSVEKQAKDFSLAGENTVDLDELANWLRRLQEYTNNPGEEYANIRAAATVWHLGFMPKSALVNAAGVPMVTVPYLSARFGWVRAAAAVTQAYTDVARSFKRPQALSEDERLMLEDLRQKGLIDASFASELAGIREGGRLADMTSLSKVGAAGFTVKQYAMWMFHKVEVANRTVTALAAYRLNRQGQRVGEEGFDTTAARAAGTTIQDTQNENAQWNRAEFMRHRKAALTMFMSYQQNLIYQMFGGDKSWMRLLAVQLAIAGLMGLPFAKDMSDLIKWFGRVAFDSDADLDRAVRGWLRKVAIEPDWLMRGASHNVFGLDLQGSLSTGRVIPGMEALASNGDFANRMANAASDVGGAGFSIIMDVLRAASSNNPNTIKRVQSALPPFFRSMTEGASALTSGRINDPQGDKLANVTPLEAMARMAGFQLTDVSTERSKRIAQRDVAAFWLTRREYVLATWGLAAKTRDPAWRKQAMDALKEFNAEAPDRNLRITDAQLKESLRRRQGVAARKERDLGPSNVVNETYRRVGELYP